MALPPFMYAEDWREWADDRDLGTVAVTLDDPPGWLDLAAACDVCARPVREHDAVTVATASGEIVECEELPPSA